MYINKGPFILMEDFNAELENIGGIYIEVFGDLNNRGKSLLNFLMFSI